MTLSDTITGTLRNLHEARELHARLSGQLREAQQRHDADYRREIDQRAAIAALISEIEVQAKALAIAAYELDPDSATPGVTVKLFSTMEYDAGAALAWAQEKRMALVPESLDVRGFEKIAKATVLPFVTYGSEPRPSIATDLGRHLPPLPATVEPMYEIVGEAQA